MKLKVIWITWIDIVLFLIKLLTFDGTSPIEQHLFLFYICIHTHAPQILPQTISFETTVNMSPIS